jgi:hypothetical protein
MMERLRPQQQQPVRSEEQVLQDCFNNVMNTITNGRALGVGKIVSGLCKAHLVNDYNTAWILTKRLADVLYSNNYFGGEAGLKKYLDSEAASMIQIYGWTPPEYR